MAVDTTAESWTAASLDVLTQQEAIHADDKRKHHFSQPLQRCQQGQLGHHIEFLWSEHRRLDKPKAPDPLKAAFLACLLGSARDAGSSSSSALACVVCAAPDAAFRAIAAALLGALLLEAAEALIGL